MVFIDLKVDFENPMCFDKVRDVTICLKNKIFCWHHFQSCMNCFSRLMFSWLVTRCRRTVFASIGELILLTPKSSKEGLDFQWEGWQYSKHRESSGSVVARE
jgi:hypothetical protein